MTPSSISNAAGDSCAVTETSAQAAAAVATPAQSAAEAPASQSGDARAVEPLRVPSGQAAFSCTPLEGGGVASAVGFSAAGVHAGFRKNPHRLDLALVVADEPCACAAVFTRNVFCAAPVQVSRAHLGEGGATSEGGPAWGAARGVVVNSGNANAATGEQGLEAARETARMASCVLGCTQQEVLVASTGVIGQHLTLEPFERGLPAAHEALSKQGGADAARAIMTTDTRPKESACTFAVEDAAWAGCTFTVGGMAKGSGMIMPNMATMIAVITTDAPVAAPDAHAALSAVAGRTFNKVTVDSDTSTNDSCFLFANGAAAPGQATFPRGSASFKAFEDALEYVCTQLARAMAADGEGASRLVTVQVTGAATPADADAAARSVANSPLVKTAVNGHDANWGRVAMALGKSGARFRQEDVSIDIMGIPVCRSGLTVPFDEDEALRRFEAPEVVIAADLGAGNASACVWTCDFSHDYITINGDYRT